MKHHRHKHSNRLNNRLDLYVNEYNSVVNKITSLSLKFSSGSYIIPISLVVGLLSISLDVHFLNLASIVLPIVLTLYMYNHVRYMALQFKLSGYARHLELKINTLVRKNVLLWENGLARFNHQGMFEGAFMTGVYVCIAVLVFYTSYNSLSTSIYSHRINYVAAFLIAAIYYFLIILTIGFLLLYTNVHMTFFKKSQQLGGDPMQSDGHPVDFKEKLRTTLTHILEFLDKPWVIIIGFIMSLVLLPLCYLPLIYCDYNGSEPLDSYEYIAVLGNKSVDDQPSADMQARLDCLISSFDKFSKARIVLSGGNGEALLMEQYLTDNGYKDYQFIFDTESQNTYENLQNISHRTCGKTLVITSDYHIFRTNYFNERLGLDYDFLPAKSTDGTLMKAIRECYALFYEQFIHIPEDQHDSLNRGDILWSRLLQFRVLNQVYGRGMIETSVELLE